MLQVNRSISFLNISNNNIEFEGISKVKNLIQTQKRELKLIHSGNYVHIEILNSVTHGMGFILAFVGFLILVSTISENDDGKSVFARII